MDETLENHTNCCRCCSKLLKTGQKTVEISKSVEKRLNDFLCNQLVISESYSSFICESCNSKLSELWDFKNELNEYQTRLYSFEDQKMKISQQIQEQRLSERNENDSTEEYLLEELKTEENTDQIVETVIPYIPFIQIENVKQRNCHICDKSISSKNFYHHMKRKHNSNEVFTCDIDGKKFNLKNDLKSHMKIHLTRVLRVRFFCATCKAPFLSMSALRTHENIFHSEFIEIHPCEFDQCDRVFPNRMKLLQHTNTVHGNKRFSCRICRKNYSSSSNLSKHLHKHSGRKGTCDVCGKSFSNIESHLLTHNQPQFKCNFINCGKAFYTKISLKAHSHLHKTNSSEAECPQCNVLFLNKKSLMRHQRRQHTSNTMQCEAPNCSITFKRKDRILHHYNRIHSDLNENIRLDLIQRAKNNKSIPW